MTGNKGTRPLRWGDVKTESQRQRVRKDAAEAIWEMAALPARFELLHDVTIMKRDTLLEWQEGWFSSLVINSRGIYILRWRYSDWGDVLWDTFRMFLGRDVKDPHTIVGREVIYTKLTSISDVEDAVEKFRVSHGDVLKIREAIEA